MQSNIEEAVLSKIASLLRMVEHPNSNKHEAAIALEKAQTLLLEHNLTRASIQTGVEKSESLSVGKIEFIYAHGHAWKTRLLNVIAKANLCQVINERHYHKSNLFGNKTNVLVVQKMYIWVCEQLEEMSLRDFKSYKLSGGYEHGKTWKAAFFDGAIAVIYQRLAKPVEVFSKGVGKELVLANDASVNAAISRVFPELTNTTHYSKTFTDGYAAGREAGKNVKFGKPEALGIGARALRSG